MELPVRRLTEARIRELLAAMPDFDSRVRRHGRTRRGRAPAPLPPPDAYPRTASLADIVAPRYSDDEREANLFRDMARLRELWGYAHAIPRSARAGIEADIAKLRETAPQLAGTATGRQEKAAKLIAARISYLESFSDEELAAVERCAPEIEEAMRRSLREHGEARLRENERRRVARRKKRGASRAQSGDL